MKRKNPRHVHEYTDRHGKARFYLRRPGIPKIPLPGLPWSPEFMAAYEAALAGAISKPQLGAARTLPGTVNAALVSYYQHSATFRALAGSTQQNRRNILERFREKAGGLALAAMPRSAVQRILDNLSPTAAKNWKKALRGFVDYALAAEMIRQDPLVGIKLAKVKDTGGHHTWTEDEISKFMERHPAGTKPRLSLMLLLQTGHARADVVRMGRQHVRAGKLSMHRQKPACSSTSRYCRISWRSWRCIPQEINERF